MAAGTTGHERRGLRAKEVCLRMGIQPYVLKFWEREFPQLGRRVGAKRIYLEETVAIASEIQRLVDEERMTLSEARAVLEERYPVAAPQGVSPLASRAPRAASEPAQGQQMGLFKQVEEKVRQLEQERREAGQERRELEKRLRASERKASRFDALREQLEESQEARRQTEQRLARLERQHAEHLEELAGAQAGLQELDRLRQRLEELETLASEQNERAERAERELVEARSAFAREREDTVATAALRERELAQECASLERAHTLAQEQLEQAAAAEELLEESAAERDRLVAERAEDARQYAALRQAFAGELGCALDELRALLGLIDREAAALKDCDAS